MKRRRLDINTSTSGDGRESNTIYLIHAMGIRPVYDRFVDNKHAVLHSKEAAIKLAKQMLFDITNKSFRGGVEKCTDREFKLEKIEDYDREFYDELVDTCDTVGGVINKEGSFSVHVYELTPSDEPDEPYGSEMIYKLPK